MPQTTTASEALQRPPSGRSDAAIVALIQRGVEAFARGDAEAYAAIFASNAVLSGELALADWDVYRGPQGAASWVREAHVRWRQPAMTLVEVRHDGRWTLVVVDLVGSTLAGGGAWRIYAAARVDADALIAELHPFVDADAAAAAAAAFIRNASR